MFDIFLVFWHKLSHSVYFLPQPWNWSFLQGALVPLVAPIRFRHLHSIHIACQCHQRLHISKSNGHFSVLIWPDLSVAFDMGSHPSFWKCFFTWLPRTVCSPDLFFSPLWASIQSPLLVLLCFPNLSILAAPVLSLWTFFCFYLHWLSLSCHQFHDSRYTCMLITLKLSPWIPDLYVLLPTKLKISQN